MTPGSQTRRGSKKFFLLFFLGVLGALTVPGLWIANRVEPMVLGLPFLLF